MESLLLVGLIVVLVIRWIYLRERLDGIDRRIDALAATAYAGHRAAAAPVVEHAAAPKPAPPPAEPSAAPAPVAVPVRVPTPPPVAAPPAPLPRPVFTTAAAAPQRTSEEWETLLGGNWLNKLGVFVLVIGIALALGYSFKHLGPAGIDAISVTISLAMLAAGVVFERRERYRIFARGLLGGGWAALYFTVYAMQAVKAARVIYNPWGGAILLLGVAVGMIFHSLRYRSQTVTGLAYFIAFVTLGITEVTSLSIAALVPLAASPLYVARRFSWGKMALFGLIATWVTVGTRPDTGAPLWEVQVIFATYWLLFEGFDLMCADPWLLPLNALGFLSLSLYKWQSVAPHQVWQFLAATAAAYLAGAILRWRSGRWQPAITLTAALAAAAIWLKLENQWIVLGLLVEAELFHLAGVRLRARYLRYLAASLFGLQVVDLLVEIQFLPVRSWTPVAALGAAVFYANRFLRSADIFYGYAAAGMVALVTGYEAGGQYRAVAWLLVALAPFAFGWWRRLQDFRVQGYLLTGLGLAGVALDLRELPLLLGAAVSYGLTLCAQFSGEDRFPAPEREAVRFAGSLAATLTLAGWVWRALPGQYLGLGWMALALPLLELGMRGWPEHYKRQAYALAAAGAVRVLYINVLPVFQHDPLAARLIPAGAALLAYAVSLRARREEGGWVRDCASLLGTLFACDALWLLPPRYAAAPALALWMLGLLYAGVRRNVSSLRWQSYGVAVLAFANCWYANLEGGLQPVLAGAAVIACLYAAQLQCERGGRARLCESLLGTALTAALLYYQVSGSLRTVAWGLQGVALLGSGFPLRDRVLRLSGLALLLGCILKLFLWDLRHLETLPRIFSFILLGMFLVGVSWIYTRFRERVARYL